MRDSVKFTTFVLGTFVFVYYITFLIKTVRVWRNVGRCPIAAFESGGLANILHAAGGALGPLPILAWAWRPSLFSRLSLLSLDNWPVRMLGLLALCASFSTG